MKDSRPPLPKGFPGNWRINLQDYQGVDKALDEMIAQGLSYLNYAPERFAANDSTVALVSRIRSLLSDTEAGAAVLDLRNVLDRNPELVDRARLLIVMIGNNFGHTVTRNHLGESPFFPVYNRKEGKGLDYIGNALSNNQPGVHTDASAWRKARVDLLALLSVQPAFFGGATIIVNALQVFDALPSEVQRFLSTRSFIRQDPFDPDHPSPVRRSVYHKVETSFYSGIGVKYHRTRIEGGHTFLKEPLTKEDTSMLDKLGEFLEQDSFRHQFRLKSGQILFLNNDFVCHDRTRFRDLGRRKRYLERYWAGEFY